MEVEALIATAIKNATSSLLHELNKQKLLSTKASDEVIDQIISRTTAEPPQTVEPDSQNEGSNTTAEPGKNKNEPAHAQVERSRRKTRKPKKSQSPQELQNLLIKNSNYSTTDPKTRIKGGRKSTNN
ncbi:MAG: hypothetical protein JAZ03_20325 [Candidatus Thiodiazotropha taylori]|nr:hypothetical protein [Candidatus Thiodiazotropha taylori]MCW4336273.1 hypothetical protein [Candidatus Thiodiazotropha endolucinida]